MLRSLPDQNEPLLHVKSFLSDQQCRSLLASAIRPVRHNAPLQLSCHCKAQEVSLIDSWRADSQSLSMALARNYPMCENVKSRKGQRILLLRCRRCRSSVCSSRSQSGLSKEYFSLRFARRCVFTRPRPQPDIVRGGLRTIASSPCALAVPARCCLLGSRYRHRCGDRRGGHDNRHQSPSSTVGRGSIRSVARNMLLKQRHQRRQHRRLPLLHGVRLHHDKRHRDRRHHDRRQRDQRQRLFDTRRRQLK